MVGRRMIVGSQAAPPLAAPFGVGLPVPLGSRGIGVTPEPAYGCYDPCPDGASEQVREYIPYLFSPFYKRFAVQGKALATLINGCIPDYRGGYCKTWWFVKCFGFDVVTDDPDNSPLPPGDVFPEGTPFSMLKLEVIGTEYGKFRARFAFDIGSRIDVNFGAYQRLEAFVLVPDFDRYVIEGGYVSVTPPYNLQDYRAKSLVVPSAVGVSALGGFRNGRFTQSLYLDNGSGQPSQTMDIPAGAKQVHVTSSSATASQTLTFLSPMTTTVSVVTAASGAVIEIPDNADRVTVALAGGDAGPRIATLVFRLDV